MARPHPGRKAAGRAKIGEPGGEYGLKEDTDIMEKGGGLASQGPTKIKGPGAEAKAGGAKTGKHHGGKHGFGATSPNVSPHGRGKGKK